MGKMQLGLALCLWICFIVCASTSNGCSEFPVVENAEVAESSKKTHYSDDDTLEYNCIPGYASQIKIIYKCSKNKWNKFRGEECSLKRCESPEDIPNGHYSIESGRNLVFGTTIKYICNEGYQMMSRFDTRTCRDSGWDNQLPSCEAVTCEQKSTEGNIRVKGLPDNPEDLIQYGHRLTFSCDGIGLILKGEKEIICSSNGEWSSPFPKCVEVTCEEEQLINVGILIGHPDIGPPYKSGQILVFHCTDVNLKMQGQRTIECLSNGKWNYPYPKCQATEVTCEGEQLIGVDILTGHPDIGPPYKPGHILLFRCTNVNLKMQGQRTIECQSNGKWDYPYPKCEDIRCEVPRDQHVSRSYEHFRGNLKLGERRSYNCESGYEKMAEEATCTRDGWTPNPLCAEIRCEVPRDQHVYSPQYYFRGEMKLGARKPYRCESGYDSTATEAVCTRNGWTPNPLCTKNTCEVPYDQHVYSPYSYLRDVKLGERRSYICESGYQKMAEEATCTRDGWTPNPLCAVLGKCGPPPQVDNADTIEMPKKEYNTGERVEYACFNKYKLDLKHPLTKYLTCQQGQWSGSIKCLKPCTVTKETMDQRGIDLAYRDEPKMFAPHDDHITFTCLRGKVSVGVNLRQKCNDGEMALPVCV